MRELSCSKVTACKYFEEPDFQEKSCNGSCSGYEWSKYFLPSKPEYFPDKELKYMVENMGEFGGSGTRKDYAQKTLDLMEEMSSWMMAIASNEKHTEYVAPEGIRRIMREYVHILLNKEKWEENAGGFYEWIIYLKEVRQEYFRFKKIVGRMGIIEE